METKQKKSFTVELDVESGGKLFIEGIATMVGKRVNIYIEFAEYSGGPQIVHLLSEYGNKRKLRSKVISMFGKKAA